MNAVSFDTLKFAQTLREKAKLTPEQAEGITEAFASASLEQLATKSDLKELASKQDVSELKAEQILIKQDIFDLRADLRETELRLKVDIKELKGDIANNKSEILKWVIGAIGFQTLVILGAVLALLKFVH